MNRRRAIYKRSAFWDASEVLRRTGFTAFELDRVIRSEGFPRPRIDRHGVPTWPRDQVETWLSDRRLRRNRKIIGAFYP